MNRIVTLALVAGLSLAGCTASGPTTPTAPASEPTSPSAGLAVAGAEASATPRAQAQVVRIVTLGDGYTLGTETIAPRRDSWPSQLAESLARSGLAVIPRNLAEQGATSGEVLEYQVGQVESWRPDIVTLQVGVNDIVAGETAWYRANVSTILDELLAFMSPERILVVTTPDHTLTEWGTRFGPTEASAAAVQELNSTLREVAQERGIEVIDIGPVNALVATDSSLVIQQDPPVPYPTAKQYAGWVEVIGPYVRDALASPAS